LQRLDSINEERRAQAGFIRDALRDVPELVFQHVPEGHLHAYHLLCSFYTGENRDDLIELLYKEYGIKCIVQYWPLYRSQLFRSRGYADIKLPNTDEFFDKMVSLPFWSGMPVETMSYISRSMRLAIERLRRPGSL
jgi:dTDP-4-amino-4,6-dideoxygalactose transaminase